MATLNGGRGLMFYYCIKTHHIMQLTKYRTTDNEDYNTDDRDIDEFC